MSVDAECVRAPACLVCVSSHISLRVCSGGQAPPSACDAIVNTVVLIRVKENNFIFGGFTGDAAWSSKFDWGLSSNSFGVLSGERGGASVHAA
jgi:hypothetical protein